MAKRGQGQSAVTTFDKERGLASMMSINMRVVARLLAKHNKPYLHLDCTSGSGWNEEVGVPGSPVVFHRVADELLSTIPRYAMFCDKDKEAIEHLQKRLDGWKNRTIIHHGDNEDGIAKFLTLVDRFDRRGFAMGSVLSDSNGYWFRNRDGEGPPTTNLPKLMSVCPRIDVMLNLSVTAYKRMLNHPDTYDVLKPIDVLNLFGKDYWLVKRNQYRSQEFLMAIGRNYRTGDHQKLGFYHLESEQGQNILKMVSTLKKDREPPTASKPDDLFGF